MLIFILTDFVFLLQMTFLNTLDFPDIVENSSESKPSYWYIERDGYTDPFCACKVELVTENPLKFKVISFYLEYPQSESNYIWFGQACYDGVPTTKEEFDKLPKDITPLIEKGIVIEVFPNGNFNIIAEKGVDNFEVIHL